MQTDKGPALKREIGAVGLGLNAINLTVGAGIFVLPALVAKNLGAAGFIAYLVCGFLVVLIMLCYAEIGSKVTDTGGSYTYVERAFGPLPGFLINTLFWFGFSCLADAAVINALTDMLALWFPAFTVTYIRIIFFIVVFGTFAWINIRGVREGSRLAISATILKLLPLVLLILVGVFSVNPGNLSVQEWPAIKSLGDTSLSLFFAFMGIETALNMGGEMKNPQKNIPRGIFIGVAGVLVIYLLIQFIAQAVLGSQLATFEKAPLAQVATRLIGPVGGTIILVTGVISMFGLLCGDILSSPRILFAASRDKLLPGFLGAIHPKFSTPYWSIIVYCAVGLIFASTGSFNTLAVLASSSILIIYLAVVLATIRLRYVKTTEEKGSFKIPGGLVVPILAIITIGWFLSHITKDEIIGLSIFFIVVTLIFFLNKNLKEIKLRRGFSETQTDNSNV